MTKICERALNFTQIIDYKGTVRLCGWCEDAIIGSLSEQSMEEIFHGEPACRLRERHIKGDYSLCNVDACPYLAMGDMKNHLVEIDEVPKYPQSLYLAFEEVCNYDCMSCTTHRTMCENQKLDLDKYYDVIEEKLGPILPYVKTIGANGRGELFASKRTLKILENWRPLAPKEEITVWLETNGSMFDEKHWKQIENLGQYNLRVAITVMSFEESAYQLLSGTKLPISKIEDNLLFVKKLREEGIVNYFEIATVVQERNFRTIPEFARRCVEEFGADYVRLRPYSPWGSQEPEIEWFMDVRQPAHPYYKEYREVMKHPILKHPKVHDWSGGLDTVNVREFPYRMSWLKEQIVTEFENSSKCIIERIREKNPSGKLIVYGLGLVGKAATRSLVENGIVPIYIVDKKWEKCLFEGIEVLNFSYEGELKDKGADVLITPLANVIAIKEELRRRGYSGNFICMKDIVLEQGVADKLPKTE